MATGEEMLTQAMLASSELVASVGDRIYPDFVRQGKPLPAIAYGQTNSEPLHTIHSPSNNHIAVFEVHCVAESRTGSINLALLFGAAMRAGKFYWSNQTAEFFPDDDVYITVFSVRVPVLNQT